jgi:hypothetical protein
LLVAFGAVDDTRDRLRVEVDASGDRADGAVVSGTCVAVLAVLLEQRCHRATSVHWGLGQMCRPHR